MARQDGCMPKKPRTVWMVELSRDAAHHEVKGTLAIESDALVFTAAATARETRIPYDAAGRVQRLRMSPVLTVRWRDTDVDRRTAFYFVQPPPLDPPQDLALRTTTPLGARRASPRRQHRQNATLLTARGSELKPTIVEWVAEIETRIRDARAGG
jgi:hypothetical protein